MIWLDEGAESKWWNLVTFTSLKNSETVMYTYPTTQKWYEYLLATKDRLQISLLILSKFKKI